MKNQEFPFNIFKDHEITIVANTPEVKRFKFVKPNTWIYGFHVTTSDNLIVMQGDCGSLLIEPGYGRDGLAFLRGSVENFGYFLSKVPLEFKDSLKEYSREEAIKGIEEWEKNEYIDKKQFERFMEDLSYENGKYGMMKYYELCHDLNIEEPPSPMVMNSQTKVQIAGLTVFAQKLKEIEDL